MRLEEFTDFPRVHIWVEACLMNRIYLSRYKTTTETSGRSCLYSYEYGSREIVSLDQQANRSRDLCIRPLLFGGSDSADFTLRGDGLIENGIKRGYAYLLNLSFTIKYNLLFPFLFFFVFSVSLSLINILLELTRVGSGRAGRASGQAAREFGRNLGSRFGLRPKKWIRTGMDEDMPSHAMQATWVVGSLNRNL